MTPPKKQSPQPSVVSGREWAWAVVTSLLVMALVSVPYLVGLAHSTPQMQFGGFLFGLDDMHSYLAKMRFGARDGWLLQLVYTGEPHAGGVAYAHFLALGKLAALISGEGAHVSAQMLVIAYHAARIVCGLLLLVVLYRFAAEFLEKPSQRRLAWALAALAGGLGWVLLVLSPAGEAALPVEFYVPEAFGILSLYGLPHLALARALLLGGWMLLFRAEERRSVGYAAAAGLLWGGMSVIVPFYAALLGVLIAARLAGLWIIQRRAPWVQMQIAVLAGALPVALLAYNVWLFSSNPVFAAWSAQNLLVSPPPRDYLLAYGLLLALAIPGAVGLARGAAIPPPDALRASRSPSPHVERGPGGEAASRRLLLLIWPPLGLLLAYAPVNVQRRLLEGVIVPLSILAALGVWRLLGERPASGKAAGWRLRQIGLAALIMLCFPSTVLLLAGGALTAARPAWPIYHPADEIEALRWLDQHAPPDSLVLATFESGNVIPAYAGVRVYVGHGPETLRATLKRQQAQAFFLGGMTNGTRRALLREAGIDYVWIGPPEQLSACTATCFNAPLLGLEPVYQSGRYAIYAVREDSP